MSDVGTTAAKSISLILFSGEESTALNINLCPVRRFTCKIFPITITVAQYWRTIMSDINHCESPPDQSPGPSPPLSAPP